MPAAVVVVVVLLLVVEVAWVVVVALLEYQFASDWSAELAAVAAWEFT